jgi:hypothetical protein
MAGRTQKQTNEETAIETIEAGRSFICRLSRELSETNPGWEWVCDECRAVDEEGKV